MATPISLLSLTQQAISETSRQSDALARLQQQVSTGKKLLVPSDDPSLSARLVANDAQTQRLGAFLTTIDSVTSTIDQGVSTMQDAADVLVSAKSLALQGAQSDNDATARAALAQQVNVLIQRLVSLGNTQQNGRYIFSGDTISGQPFVISATDKNGNPTKVTYQGSTSVPTTLAGPGQTVNPYIAGNVVFGASTRGTPVYLGNTGAKPGSGTDSATADVSLVVTHTATTYAPGSGVQVGTSSATGDTILGPAGAHTLTIVDTVGDGSAGTVSLDGGPPTAFTNGDTNLKVGSNNGDVVYIDTTAIAAGFNGSVDITSDGTLSTDGGATTTPIDFSGNQQVTDSTTGTLVNVDTSALKRTGTEAIHETGSYDPFEILISLRDDLLNSSIGNTAQGEAIASRLGELDQAHQTIMSSVGGQSAQLQGLQGLQSHVTALQLTTKKTASTLGDADLTDLIVQLQTQSTLLQMTYAGITRMFSTNLLDFLK